MSWTDATTVKLHLQAFSVDSLDVRFLPIILSGTDVVQLPHNTLADGSFTLHSMLAAEPSGPVDVTLTGTSWQTTGADAALPLSLVVAAADPPTSRYIEGVDYAVEDETARIKRIDSGAISSGATVKVWLLPLTAFVEGSDFELDTTSGQINRLDTGDLPDPARVYASYSTNASGASEALIGQAITEAERKILDHLRDGYDASSTDEGLTIGATELTLSILCDDLAMRALTGVGDPAADDRARRFMDLAVRFHQRAIATLSRFLKAPLPSVSTPQGNTSSAIW